MRSGQSLCTIYTASESSTSFVLYVYYSTTPSILEEQKHIYVGELCNIDRIILHFCPPHGYFIFCQYYFKTNSFV